MLRQILQLSVVLGVAGLLVFASCKKDPEVSPPAPEKKVDKPTEGQPYAASLAPQPTYTAGMPGVVVATVVARDGFHVNPDYPVAFKPAAESTVKFAGERVALGDGRKKPCEGKSEDACQAEFDVPFTTSEPGSNSVQGVLAFSVCSADKCLIEKVPLTLAIDVR